MKVRIIKSINEDLLDEAKEDDLIAKYKIGMKDQERDIHLFDFKKVLDWLHGSALKFAPGSTAKEMVANAKEITNAKDFVSKRKDRIKFLPWIMKMIAGGESRKQVIDAADIFEKYSPQFKKRNLGSYKSPDQIIATYKEEVVAKRVAKARKERGKTEPHVSDSDRHIVYEDDNLFVVRPLTVDASCHYGRKTKWCIAQEDNDYFREYTEDDGKVFYFIKDDRRKNDDPYYKVAIQIGIDSYSNDVEIDGYWDRYDNPDDQRPLPVRDLKDKYREGEMEKILAAIEEHVDEHPPELGERGKLQELEESIFDGNWDTNYVNFHSEMYDEGDYPAIYISSNISFKLQVKIFEDQDSEYVDEHWDDAMESGMGDDLMEVLTYHEEFLSGYEEPTDIFTLGAAAYAGSLNEDEIRVSFEIPSQLNESAEQAESFMNTVQNTYGAEDIEDLTDKLTSVINKWMADRINPGSLEKIKDVAKDIWNMNSKYKHMQAEYNEDDNEVYFAQKKMYTVPLKIPVFNKAMGWSEESKIVQGIKKFRAEVRKRLESKIKSAVETAMKEIDERASKFAQRQMTMYFKLKPSLRGVGVLPWRMTVHVAAFSVDQIRQKSAQEGLPTLKADINLELNKADDEDEIKFALQYVSFVDKYLPEIYELAMKKLDIDKYQKEINNLFMILVQASQLPEEEPVNESKRRIKVRIK
jgi:hypothetical protein